MKLVHHYFIPPPEGEPFCVMEEPPTEPIDKFILAPNDGDYTCEKCLNIFINTLSDESKSSLIGLLMSSMLEEGEGRNTI